MQNCEHNIENWKYANYNLMVCSFIHVTDGNSVGGGDSFMINIRQFFMTYISKILVKVSTRFTSQLMNNHTTKMTQNPIGMNGDLYISKIWPIESF